MVGLADFDIEGLRTLFAGWGCKAAHADRLLGEFYRSAGRVDLAKLKLGRELLGHIQRELPLRQSRVDEHFRDVRFAISHQHPLCARRQISRLGQRRGSEPTIPPSEPPAPCA
jgi:hypothetical protein